ncbi:hypothetical protein FSW04_24000 [Baekduia soli]|uniref:Uncharacterized protein n=1 Tax=Baekduia soli TaxID=496014 RepID=A0A5B8UAW3_9ACTN|nr:hypothetical protein [Baekduia soli]QEC50343.1 hypothetical protein FSW04_24000 [Baekduia soli]
MPPCTRPRVTRPVMRLAAAAAVLVLAGCGSAAAGHRTPAAQAAAHQAAGTATATSCPAAVAGELRTIAQRIYRQAAAGRNVVSARRRLARSQALARAVYAGDPAATMAALHPLLKNQIHRIRITRGVHLLADVGHSPAPAPVHGLIRDPAGHPVGRYVMSVTSDAAIAGITRTVTGADVVMGPHAHGTASFAATAYPSGPMRVALVIGQGAQVRCGATPAATRGEVVRSAGLRLLASETGGAQARRVLRHVATDRGFLHAVAANDPVALRAAIIRFFRQRTLHVVRIRAVAADGRLVGDVGGPYVLAPASRTLRTTSGHVLGRVTLSVQDDTGYIKLMHRFTGAGVVLRGPAGLVPGSVALHGPGLRTVHLTAPAFPSGRLAVALQLRG